MVNEINKIGKEMDYYASLYGMTRKEFLNNADRIDSETAIKIIPLLERRIYLLRQLWYKNIKEKGVSNVVLFTRKRYG